MKVSTLMNQLLLLRFCFWYPYYYYCLCLPLHFLPPQVRTHEKGELRDVRLSRGMLGGSAQKGGFVFVCVCT